MSLLIPIGIAAAKGVKSIYDYFQNRGAAKDLQSATEKQQMARKAYLKGVYEQSQKGNIDVAGRLQGYRSEVMGQAAAATTRTRGELISRGMEGSIAGVSALGAPRRTAMGLVGREQGRLTAYNEESKVRAKEAYTRGLLEHRERAAQENLAVKQAKRGAGQQLAGGLIGTGAELGLSYLQSKMPPTAEQQLMGQRLEKGALEIAKMKKEIGGVPIGEIPEDFHRFTTRDLMAWASQNKRPFDEAQAIQQKLLIEMIKEGKY